MLTVEVKYVKLREDLKKSPDTIFHNKYQDLLNFIRFIL